MSGSTNWKTYNILNHVWTVAALLIYICKTKLYIYIYTINKS